MSEENKKRTGGSGSGRPSGGSSKGSPSRSGSSKSGASRGTAGSGSSRSGSSGSSSKGSRPASASSGASKSGAAKNSTSGKSSSRASKSGASSGSSKSGAKKSSSSSGAAKSSAGKTSPAGRPSGSAAAKKPASQSKKTSGSAKKRGGYDDIPHNPRRDTQAERDLHNSPSAKRIAEERRRRTYNKNRRLYNFMFYAAITVAVISVVIILSVTVLFNISEINVVRGEDVPYTDAEIMVACGIEPGDNLFAIDAEQISADVREKLPYIEVCRIKRRLPSTLELDVRPAVVLGSVTSTDGAYIMMSASGRALEFADNYTGAPAAHLNGLNVGFNGIGLPMTIEDQAQLDVAAEIVVGYSLYGITLDSITFEAAGSIDLSYDERIEIYIGVPTNLSQKIQVSASMITDGKIARNESGVLDMSIDERAVFTPDYLLGDKDYGEI